jgi:hypothetical protein
VPLGGGHDLRGTSTRSSRISVKRRVEQARAA